MSKVTNDTDSLFKTYSSIIWLLAGLLQVVYWVWFWEDGVINRWEIYFKFTFTAIIPLIFFTTSSIGVLRNQKARKIICRGHWCVF
jgi:hypothetical protein